MLKTLTKILFEAIVPTRCLGCNKFGLYFCSRCLRTVYLIDKQKCPVCEKRSVGGKTHSDCAGRYILDGLLSLFEYRGVVRSAITQLKYRGLTDIDRELTRLINYVFKKFYEEDLLVELEDFIFYNQPVVVPIPLHWWRKMERKFNQAEFIAKIFATEYKLLLLPDLLIRTKNTKQQTKLKGKERINSVKGIFRVRKEYLTRKSKKSNGKIHYKLDESLASILLVDDVATTGATLKSAANTLKRSGAREVWALTLAS